MSVSVSAFWLGFDSGCVFEVGVVVVEEVSMIEEFRANQRPTTGSGYSSENALGVRWW